MCLRSAHNARRGDHRSSAQSYGLRSAPSSGASFTTHRRSLAQSPANAPLNKSDRAAKRRYDGRSASRCRARETDPLAPPCQSSQPRHGFTTKTRITELRSPSTLLPGLRRNLCAKLGSCTHSVNPGLIRGHLCRKRCLRLIHHVEAIAQTKATGHGTHLRLPQCKRDLLFRESCFLHDQVLPVNLAEIYPIFASQLDQDLGLCAICKRLQFDEPDHFWARKPAIGL